MNTSVTKFEEGKYYVMSGKGTRWSDFDGAFDSNEDAISHLRQFVSHDYSAPECINGMVVVRFLNNQLHLFRNENGDVVDGKLLCRFVSANV